MLPWLVAVVPPSFSSGAETGAVRADAAESPAEHRIEPPIFEYGAGIVAGVLISTGGICKPDPAIPCVLDSGGGLGVHFGYSPKPVLRLGGAYEVSKHDAHKVLALGILQQVRGEARFRLATGGGVPYVVVGLGVAFYGSNWAADTWGPAGLVGFGLELLLSQTAALDFQISYRGIAMRSWSDPTGTDRPAGVASIFGLEIGFEHLEPVRDASVPSSLQARAPWEP